jgi:hypothetical protein
MILRPAENPGRGFHQTVPSKPMIQTFYEKNETCRTPGAESKAPRFEAEKKQSPYFSFAFSRCREIPS